MTDLLEHRLTQLAELLDVSVDERLVIGVLAALDQRMPDRRVWPSAPRRPGKQIVWAAIAAAALLVVLAIPDARHAVARWLGIGNTRLEHVPDGVDTTATFPASPTAGATVDIADIGDILGIGAPMSASAASTRTGLPVPVAPGLGNPQGVYVTSPPSTGHVIVVFSASSLLPSTPVAGVGALLATSPGLINEGSFVKSVGPDVVVEAVQVTTHSGAVVDGFWLSGAPHTYGFTNADGRLEVDSLRLATNTLLWVVDDVQYRFESSLTRDAALAVAKTVTRSP